MRHTRQLMSIEEAAGFAMAPSEDDMSEPFEMSPDEALRNGHVTAARDAVGSLPKPPGLAHEPHGATWVRETLFSWWGGKAHA